MLGPLHVPLGIPLGVHPLSVDPLDQLLALPVAALLGALALVLLGPGALWVARWRFLYRVPRAAVVLWQAGTLSALLSVFGAGVLVGVWAFGPFASAPGGRPIWALLLAGVLVAFTPSVAVRLIWSLTTVARPTAARRRRHLAAVDLLGEVGDRPDAAELRVLAERLPIA